MHFETLNLTIDRAVATIEVDRPDSLNASMENDYQAARAVELQAWGRCFASADRIEGMRASQPDFEMIRDPTCPRVLRGAAGIAVHARDRRGVRALRHYARVSRTPRS